MEKAYSGVDTLSGGAVKPSLPLSRRKLHIFSLLFMCVFSFSSLGLSISKTSLAAEVQRITSYWSPNLSGLGKLKYVDGEEQVFSMVENFSLPFDFCVATNAEGGGFLIDGLGALVVKACMEGRVERIDVDSDGLKAITLSHGSGLKSEYSLIETAGVKVGDGVEKNTPIGICSRDGVCFKVFYKNKLMTGLTISGGQLSFL